MGSSETARWRPGLLMLHFALFRPAVIWKVVAQVEPSREASCTRTSQPSPAMHRGRHALTTINHGRHALTTINHGRHAHHLETERIKSDPIGFDACRVLASQSLGHELSAYEGLTVCDTKRNGTGESA